MFKLVAVLLVLGSSLTLPALQAQASYSFCTEDTEIPPQELTNAIANFLDANYEGDVELVRPVCYGQNPRMNYQDTWVYEAEFGDGSFLDVAVYEGANGRRISVQDRQSTSDASGWTNWLSLD